MPTPDLQANPTNPTGKPLFDRLVRSSRRRTLGIVIRHNAEVHIHAPAWMTMDEIERLLRSRQRWIATKKAEIIRETAALKERPADIVLYRGKEYQVSIRTDAIGPVYLDEAVGLIISADYISRKNTMIRSWLSFKAEEVITARTVALAAAHKIPIAAIRFSDTASQWGSCSSTGNLSFCWRLIMCPDRVIDYVIIHELAHCRQLNHSPRFWELVETMCPEYQDYRSWLRRHSRLLRHCAE